MKNLKKLSALILALVMALSLCVNAGAATSDPNFTAAPNTAWSTAATAGTPVTVAAGPASAYFSFTGFDSAADAEAVSVTFNCGENLLVDANSDGKGDYTVASTLVASTNTYAAAITVTPKANVTGPVSIHVAKSSAANAPSVDLTIYVEKVSGNVADATNVTVEVLDLHGDTYMYETGSDLTVKAAAKETANPYGNNAAGCAQTYPTAGDALYAMMRAGNISFTQAEGYVGTITDTYENELTGYTNEDWTVYWGWNYCVLHNTSETDVADYTIVAESSVVSASVMPVQSGDIVIWAFGTESECAYYFAEAADMY